MDKIKQTARKLKSGTCNMAVQSNEKMKLTTFNDIEALRSGDHDAFDRIYLTWRKPILNMTCKLCGDKQEAEDITQEVFIKLWQYREKLDPRVKINTYLYLVAKRTAIDLFRRKRIAGEYANTLEWDEIDSAASDSMIINKEIELMKEIALDQMPEHRRNIYNLSHQEGLNTEEIARRLNITKDTVYTQLSIARKQLRELVGYLSVLLLIQ